MVVVGGWLGGQWEGRVGWEMEMEGREGGIP